ncbi:MAG: hypothetical protein JWN66_4379 [Sphingomonas bacterium]|uniref:DUF4350 domain-containing protein n=1 Tax=Sphingomonas bacterium TaxID=1895847 RepID=UPI00260A45C4|nr:hypothetical protein [Sphingomonas bacterium]MDB5707263.1 hypothetical protein [Sphingomonas bacterium]
MSDVTISRGNGEDGAFRARTVVLILAIGILGFIATLVLGAYAPDLRSGRNGGAHALSTAAVGYSGIVRLAQATGLNPQIVRDEHLLDTEDLVVLTPEAGATDISKALAQRSGRPTLILLPKWDVVADPLHPGWVRYTGLKYPFDPEGVLAPKDKLTIARHPSGGSPLVTSADLPRTIHFVAPRPLQTMSGGGLKPMITDQQGRIVLGQLPDRTIYVLSDPDLLSNIGMADARQARSALELLEWLNSNEASSVSFDVTLNGFGHSPSPLKLAFDPPFLAMTLTVAIAVLLAAWQAIARFGAPRRRARAIAFGKAALIDNAAALVRKAGRQAMLGGRYVDVVRDRAAIVFGLPPRLRDGALDAYLDGLGRSARFTELAEKASDARDRHEVLYAARALHKWLWEKSK